MVGRVAPDKAGGGLNAEQNPIRLGSVQLGLVSLHSRRHPSLIPNLDGANPNQPSRQVCLLQWPHSVISRNYFGKTARPNTRPRLPIPALAQLSLAT